MPQAIPLIALGVSTVATGYQIYQSTEARSDAKAASRRASAVSAITPSSSSKTVSSMIQTNRWDSSNWGYS